MNFKVKINNIGKLKDVEISLKPFTILAGPNNTGKSFISKTLYSVLSPTRNPLQVYMQEQFKPLKETLQFIRRRRVDAYSSYDDSKQQKKHDLKQTQFNIKKILYNQSRQAISHIRTLEKVLATKINQLDNINDFDNQRNEYLNLIAESSKKILSLFSIQNKTIKSSGKSSRVDEISIVTELDTIQKGLKKNIDKLNEIKKEPLEKIIIESMMKIIESNLAGNFQTSVLSDLLGDSNKPADIILQTGQENEIKISLFENNIRYNSSMLKLTQNSFRAIYLESPFYWKLEDILTNPIYGFFPEEREIIFTPKYFQDLEIMLRQKLTGDPAFPKILNELHKDIIKGKIFEDETGTLKFKENQGGSYTLPSTATGVVQLGILALLIEKKALDKGTILFIDEPEVNLHPAWQVKMMEILFKLVNKGAFVVMATHSVDMLKWLEVHLQKKPHQKKIVALNNMNPQKKKLVADAKKEDNIQNQIRAIKKNLTDPYLKMYLEGEE